MRHYAFTDSRVLPAHPARVQEVLVDLEHYPSWWPQVCAVGKLSDDDALVLCRSRLPYTLELRLTAVHRLPHLLEVTIGGDLDGFARYDLAPHPQGTRLDYTQRVRVVGRGLAAASWLARPALVWNHRRMMQGGMAGLEAQLRSSAGR